MENNEIPILENAFDLWLDNQFQYTGSTIARKWESVNPDVQKYVSYLMPKDEIQKIKTYQKVVFESCVEVFVTELKEIFNNDPDTKKVDRYHESVVWLLNGSKYDNVVELLPYMKERFLVGFVRTYIGIKDIREFYEFYHINKILNYSQITPSTKEAGFYKDFVQVVVVAYIKFLDWLKEKEIPAIPQVVDGKDKNRTQKANEARSRKKEQNDTLVKARYLELINSGMAEEIALNKLTKEFTTIGKIEKSRKTMIVKIIKPLR